MYIYISTHVYVYMHIYIRVSLWSLRWKSLKRKAVKSKVHRNTETVTLGVLAVGVGSSKHPTFLPRHIATKKPRMHI